MQLGIIGLGRMGADIALRLMWDGHQCVAYDIDASAVAKLETEGAARANSLEGLAAALVPPRAIWLTLSAELTDSTVDALAPFLSAGDVVIDGGNSYYRDDVERATRLAASGVHYVDVGTSGGIFGLERGFCLMIGGDSEVIQRLDPIFQSLAPGVDTASRTPGRHGRASPAEHGYLHCGLHGAGHFVKMVHSGIEYGIVAAYAEGLNILHHANIGGAAEQAGAEATPLRHPEHYRYDLPLEEISEVWRRGSVIASWLLDVTAGALWRSPDLADLAGDVSECAEGRWAALTAVEEGVPTHVLTAALYDRFNSRGEGDFGNRVVSAMRREFAGHQELPVRD